ncbi:MAG TPA: hypothetical protein EYN66_14730 [Myxococcales bacterium]|nr:hypothetical protein [Myxococcales bacterium]
MVNITGVGNNSLFVLIGALSLLLSGCSPDELQVVDLQLECAVTGEQGLAVRAWVPSEAQNRFSHGTSVVLRVAGAGTSGFTQTFSPLDLTKQGVGVMQYLSPGTSSESFSSGGVEAFYADSEVEAISCVLEHLNDDAEPFVGVSAVVATGISIGGNSLLNAVVNGGAPVDGVSLWESPLIDQLVLEEPSVGGSLDPDYKPGHCTLDDGCLFDHWEQVLAYDVDSSLLYRDDNLNGVLDLNEPLYEYRETNLGEPVYSKKMTRSAEQWVFGGQFPNGWLSGEEVDQFWIYRDAADALTSVRDEGSTVPYIYIATGVDHVQLVHDHVILAQEGLIGADFFRLNPDAAYREAIGEDGSLDLPAGDLLMGHEALSMLPEGRSGAMVLAGELELIDRVQTGAWDPDLDQVITWME